MFMFNFIRQPLSQSGCAVAPLDLATVALTPCSATTGVANTTSCCRRRQSSRHNNAEDSNTSGNGSSSKIRFRPFLLARGFEYHRMSCLLLDL